MKKSLAILCCAVLFSAAFLSCAGEDDGNVQLRVGMTLTLDSHYGMGLQEFARLVDLYTDGTVSVEIFPNSLLGNERDLIESVSMGMVPMALISTGPVPNFFPDFAVLDLPFLFPSREIAYYVLDGPVGTYLLNQFPAQGIVGLGFWENGFRHVTNRVREIRTPADLAGLRIRTMENDIHMDAYREYGASPLPMAMGEVFIALQQGVIDGQENPAINIYTSRLHEVQGFMSLTGNFYSAAILMINRGLLEGMTQEQQDGVWRAATEAKHWQRNFSQENDQDAIERIRASGTLVTEVDLAVWIEASQATYRNFEASLNQNLIQQIRAITQ
jgi:tripartite ATP-independent transporter DctP family solute receptor